MSTAQSKAGDTRNAAMASKRVDEQQFLTFSSAGGQYGASILGIKEIIQYGQVTDVPLMPGEIRGVINLRGAVVPVIDLAVRFARPASVVGRRTCIVIIEIEHEGEPQDIGVLVDAVSEVVEIPLAEIEAAPSFGAAVRSDFIQGMAKVGGRFVILLDIAATFSFVELTAAVAAVGAERALVN